MVKYIFCMKKRILPVVLLVIFITSVSFYLGVYTPSTKNQAADELSQGQGGLKQDLHPLSIEYMRTQEYPGSDIVIEQSLPQGSNYNRYITSYTSDGLKIYALLTVPQGEKPKNGWPVIIFNHGYIPAEVYRTTERYVAYTDAFSRNGYILFKPDFRGNGSSEGKPEGAYYSPAYTRDVLNAVSSIKQLSISSFWQEQRVQNPGKDAGRASMTGEPLADSNRIGMWGHSMGGSITLRAMVVDPKGIKAGVIWAGVVVSYEDMAKNWHRARPFVASEREQFARRGRGRQALIDKYGDLDKNPTFWSSIAPISYIKDLSAPIQIHHGTADEEVPVLFSQRLDDALKKAGKTGEFYTYPEDDHNISKNLTLALERSVAFFDRYLKR